MCLDLQVSWVQIPYNFLEMLNKNVADYTNFDGKTNKKIVQAPGGATSFSLAWNNNPIDYGPERAIRKKDNYPSQHEPPQRPTQTPTQKSNSFNYNEPIRVMEDKYAYQQHNYPPQRQDSYEMPSNYPYKDSYQDYNSHQMGGQGGSKKYGGEYGYNQFSHEEGSGIKPNYGQDSLDRKMEEHFMTKNTPVSRPPQHPTQKPSIRIHEQKGNLVLGDNSYNYWKEPADDRKRSHQSNRPPLYEQPVSQFDPRQQSYPQEKTSVKVHNPPGGKSSFTLG